MQLWLNAKVIFMFNAFCWGLSLKIVRITWNMKSYLESELAGPLIKSDRFRYILLLIHTVWLVRWWSAVVLFALMPLLFAVAIALEVALEVAVIVITYGDLQCRTHVEDRRLLTHIPIPCHTKSDFEDANGTASRSQTAPNLCNQNQPKWMRWPPWHSMKLPAWIRIWWCQQHHHHLRHHH